MTRYSGYDLIICGLNFNQDSGQSWIGCGGIVKKTFDPLEILPSSYLLSKVQNLSIF